jgi:hypothetical protein
VIFSASPFWFVLVVMLAGGCRDAPPPSRPATLAEYLATVAGADEASRAREVAGWKVDRATWERTVVEAYRGIHDDYAHAFDGAAPGLVARLASRATITTRAHYAGDPRLTVGQARTRWALPVQFPSEVAELDGAPLDAVFVRDGDRWRAITGLDAVIRARVAALDPACAAHLEGLRSGRCSDVGWVIADAALRADPPRFAHACTLATNLCPSVVNGTP